MYDILKNFIEEKGNIKAAMYRAKHAYKTNKITESEYTDLLNMINGYIPARLREE